MIQSPRTQNLIEYNEVTKDSGVSCDKCRVRKIRCSRQLPTCDLCKRIGIPCIYPKVSHRRRRIQQIQNTGVLDFNQGYSKNKVVKKNPDRNTMFNFSQFNPSDIGQLPFGLQLTSLISMNTPSDESDLIVQRTLYDTNQIRFQPHLMLMLYSQIMSANSAIGNEVGWFFDQIKHGIFGGVEKSYFRMNNAWVKELYNPNFKQQTLDNYFKYFHHWVTYFGKQLFYENLDKTEPVLLSVILFVGYQYTNNQHKELLTYLEHIARLQLKKNFFKASKSTCQALFIFSYAIFFRGCGKQSLRYFYQACRISTILGIHLDIKGLKDIHQNERRCIRSMGLCQDQHFSNTLTLPPYFIFMVPITSRLEPRFQIIKGDSDEMEQLEAESLCLLRRVFDRYWMPATNHMSVFTLKNQLASNNISSEQLQKCCHFIGKMFDYCLVNSCREFLNLYQVYSHPKFLHIHQKYVWIFTCLYHQWILLVHSQRYPKFDPITNSVDYHTWRGLKAVKAIYNITMCNTESGIYMYYHYLSAISFFYVKLYLNSEKNSVFQLDILGELSKIYNIFIKYKKEYSFPNDTLDALDEILKLLGLKLIK
ncbi:hypothetical protein CONCODRAFT_15118 [Conidiobolus coronatus NRRL 28638]|uniref:Zn(2)-C6 fungal-type domain-containing protein n=1 Tax=Conidiobolus coronatus (strain ATCC 28846 / CBS 209.66 / NRRL 28638) TaxID=796925 RepID=A0A137PGF8_CONC2|nr:hypothetical protein CONCODRAFT_15118 [Conidiobolus coronatus NRRL 28638]|eukprot:KXN74087.1 hypothetical protein CONCODRAFT_15118 [Conidiobolus coronatus NRRL 28638]